MSYHSDKLNCSSHTIPVLEVGRCGAVWHSLLANSFWRLPYIETVLLPPNAFSGLKISQTFAAGALPELHWGSLQCSPRPPGCLAEGEREWQKGKGEGDGRRMQRGGKYVHTSTSLSPFRAVKPTQFIITATLIPPPSIQLSRYCFSGMCFFVCLLSVLQETAIKVIIKELSV